MNHTLSSLITLSAASLILASGCASSPTRAQMDEPQSQDEAWSTNASASSVQSTQYESTPLNDELVIGTLFSTELMPTYHTPVVKITLGEIQSELEAMYELDRQMVSDTDAQSEDGQYIASTIYAIDRVHSERLKEIVDHIGWPSRDLVGLKATQGAYMVIQHAGHDIEFQNRCLAMMVDMVEQGDLPASYVALLTDRIRVFQDQPQVFGTQMAMLPNEHGLMVPTPTVPIEDPEHLDDRRRLMGMPPHQEFVSAIAIAYEASRVDAGNAFANVLIDD
ncbi:MAG: hypothetical protein JKX70_12130 [Phycisphaerales bacterium]|nr:hypothetical protein [Phycisphaerales bacterium]